MFLALGCATAGAQTTLRLGNGPEVETLDPHLARSVSAANVLRDLYEGLTRMGPDGSIGPGASRTYRLNVQLSALESRLDPAQFVRIHRSHLVNLDSVAAIAPYDGSRFQVTLRGGAAIVASRQRSRVLRQLVHGASTGDRRG